jgi:hypothetical protein
MLQLWLLAFVAQIPVPQNQPVQPGLANPGEVKPASAPAMPPPLTPEQIADRLSLQITGLANRIQTLKKYANVTTSVDASTIPAPESRPSLDALRNMAGEVSREMQVRAHAIEARIASGAADGLLKSREAPHGGFKPAPDAIVKEAPPGAAPVIALPALDPTKAGEIIYKLGKATITRGELETMVEALRPYMPEATMEQVASAVIRRSLIPLAVARDSFPEEIMVAFKKAKTLREEVVEKKLTFEESVKKNSEEKVAKAFGGLMDGATAMILTDFEHAAISKLKPGEVSEPFMTSVSVEIVELIEKTPGPTMPQTTFKFRRLVLGVDMGPDREATLVNKQLTANVIVLDPRYETFLPPNVKRTVTPGSNK